MSSIEGIDDGIIGYGVLGRSNNHYGMIGNSYNGVGIRGTSSFSSGLFGISISDKMCSVGVEVTVH